MNIKKPPYMVWAPSYECEVILLFGILLPYLDQIYLIDEYSDNFPDSLLITPDGHRIRTEFEVDSYNFDVHKHNPQECDLIICWKDNWPKCPIKVLELSSIVHDLQKQGIEIIQKPHAKKSGKTKWNKESFFQKVSDGQKVFITKLYDHCKSDKNLRVEFGEGPKEASFRVYLSDLNAPTNVIVGVKYNGNIWFLLDEDVLTRPVAKDLEERLCKISMFREKICKIKQEIKITDKILTDQFFKELENDENIPKDVITPIKKLKDEIYENKKFIDVIENIIGEGNIETYKTLILKHTPLKSWPEFIIKDDNEFKIVKDVLSWLVHLEWKNIRATIG